MTGNPLFIIWGISKHGWVAPTLVYPNRPMT